MATATIEHSTDVPGSPDEVWSRFKDFSSFADWNVNHVAFPDGTLDLGPDAEYREQLQVRGAPGEVKWTVSSYEENRRAVLEGKGPMGIKLHRSSRWTAPPRARPSPSCSSSPAI